MKKLLVPVLMFLLFISCSGLESEEAGICVRCTREATAALEAVDIEACSNGDGTITVTENGTSITSENDTETFRLAQEAREGVTCN